MLWYETSADRPAGHLHSASGATHHIRWAYLNISKAAVGGGPCARPHVDTCRGGDVILGTRSKVKAVSSTWSRREFGPRPSRKTILRDPSMRWSWSPLGGLGGSFIIVHTSVRVFTSAEVGASMAQALVTSPRIWWDQAGSGMCVGARGGAHWLTRCGTTSRVTLQASSLW